MNIMKRPFKSIKRKKWKYKNRCFWLPYLNDCGMAEKIIIFKKFCDFKNFMTFRCLSVLLKRCINLNCKLRCSSTLRGNKQKKSSSTEICEFCCNVVGFSVIHYKLFKRKRKQKKSLICKFIHFAVSNLDFSSGRVRKKVFLTIIDKKQNIIKTKQERRII